MIAATRQMLLYGIMRSPCDFTDFLYLISLEIEQQDGRALLSAQACKGRVKLLIATGSLGLIGLNTLGVLYADRLSCRPHMTYICIIGNTVDPRLEFRGITERIGTEIRFHVCLLGDIVGKGRIAATKSRQKAPKRFLTLHDIGCELLAGHRRVTCPFSAWTRNILSDSPRRLLTRQRKLPQNRVCRHFPLYRHNLSQYSRHKVPLQEG